MGENDIALNIHHGSDKAGEFIIIGKHQLRDRNGIVLIDDGDDVLLQKRSEAGLHVEVMQAVAEITFRDQNLRSDKSMLQKEIVIGADQLDLSGGGEHLPGSNRCDGAGEFDN